MVLYKKKNNTTMLSTLTRSDFSYHFSMAGWKIKAVSWLDASGAYTGFSRGDGLNKINITI